MRTAIITVFFAFATMVTPQHAIADSTAEIMLIDTLDEPRGFCIDVLGYKHKANPERGLQAHSCYSYQGSIAVDQAFDDSAIKRSEFRLPWFDLCMTAPALTPGQRPALEPCNGNSRQKFSMGGDGLIYIDGETRMCLTVTDGPSRKGGGGSPVHVIRRLTIESCEPQRTKWQRWRTRKVQTTTP